MLRFDVRDQRLKDGVHRHQLPVDLKETNGHVHLLLSRHRGSVVIILHLFVIISVLFLPPPPDSALATPYTCSDMLLIIIPIVTVLTGAGCEPLSRRFRLPRKKLKTKIINTAQTNLKNKEKTTNPPLFVIL